MRKSIPKVENTEERKQVQKELRAFFKRNPEIVFRELRPTGFEIDIRTIPLDKVVEFLIITKTLYP